MLNDVLIEIADEVVNDLNAQLFSMQFTAERAYVPRFNLAEAKTRLPVVTVTPRDLESETATRGLDEVRFGLDVCVCAKVPDVTPASCDPLFALTLEIRDRYAHYVVLGGRGVSIEPGVDPVFDRDWLQANHEFFGLVQLTLTTMR